MKSIKRFVSIILIMCMFVVSGCGNQTDTRMKVAKSLKLSEPVTITVWYNDEAYESYLDLIAEQFHLANELVTIKPVYIETEDYVNYIYNESVRNDNACDIYFINSEEVEKAYLMGLMSENDLYDDVFNEKAFGKAAITACSYKDKLYGYPVSFNTSFLMYNKATAERVTTFDEIKEISDNWQVTEENSEVIMVFNWDPGNMFLNYAVAGKYLNIGGENAENGDDVSLNEEKIKQALNKFSALNSTFGIARNTASLEKSNKMFTEGGLMYTITDAESIHLMDEAKIDYGIAPYPSLGDGLESRALSTTTMAVVNPYTENVDVSKAVARAISYDFADYMEATSGKCCARGNLVLSVHEDAYAVLHRIYSNSVVKAKYIGVGEIYLRYEIMLHQAYDGTSVDDAYNSFSNVVKLSEEAKTKADQPTEAPTK